MKTLGKLNINTEKLMKNEELVILRGGYGDNCCTCREWNGTVINYIAASDPDNCNSDCFRVNGTGFGTWDCLI